MGGEREGERTPKRWKKREEEKAERERERERKKQPKGEKAPKGNTMINEGKRGKLERKWWAEEGSRVGGVNRLLLSQPPPSKSQRVV